MNEKKENALLQQERSQTQNYNVSIPTENQKVNPLKELRMQSATSARDMVAVVRTLYPKYDKTCQSKCENSEMYGVRLMDNAMKALQYAFGTVEKETPKPAKANANRLPCRIYGRLDTVTFDLLRDRLKNDGYSSVQAWLLDMTAQYLKEEHK